MPDARLPSGPLHHLLDTREAAAMALARAAQRVRTDEQRGGRRWCLGGGTHGYTRAAGHDEREAEGRRESRFPHVYEMFFLCRSDAVRIILRKKAPTPPPVSQMAVSA